MQHEQHAHHVQATHHGGDVSSAQEVKSGGHTGHSTHDKHAGHDPDMFRSRFWLSLLLSVPVVLYSEMVQEWLNISMPEFPGSSAIPPVLGTFIFFYGGLVFLKGGWTEIRERAPGMMLLISLAITVAFLASAASTAGWLDLEFWWELALLVTIMLLGHWQEMRAIGQAQNALSALAALLPDEAERVEYGEPVVVPVTALRTGDMVLVRPGARIPADGTVTDGRAEVDESLLTGESRPVEKEINSRVVAGAVVLSSSLRVRVDAVGEATAMAGIQRMVAEAQASRSRAQALADRFAAALFYVAIGAAAISFVVWSIVGSLEDAITHAVTVLVISCPHALGLAIPLVIALSTAVGARQGILVKDRLALERMRLVDTVLFDKTGTLTQGEHEVVAIAPIGLTDTDLLALAAAVERDSEHPVARAIVRAAESANAPMLRATAFTSVSGRGVEAHVENHRIAVGGPALLRERGLESPPALARYIEEWESRGSAVLHVIEDDHVAGALALADKIRPESNEAIRTLSARGVRTVMITGDSHAVAQAVASDLGISEVFAEVLPHEKERAVSELQRRGETVAMVGDGVNDAPALARADVGIAIGAGTDVAIKSAGMILASSDPRSVVGIRVLSEQSYRKMIQNLAWAAGYNVIAIPIAAGVLEPVGISMPPAVGAVLMSVSTIVVALNAQLLRGLRLKPSA
jgi:Cu2+-exporting ATPase